MPYTQRLALIIFPTVWHRLRFRHSKRAVATAPVDHRLSMHAKDRGRLQHGSLPGGGEQPRTTSNHRGGWTLLVCLPRMRPITLLCAQDCELILRLTLCRQRDVSTRDQCASMHVYECVSCKSCKLCGRAGKERPLPQSLHRDCRRASATLGVGVRAPGDVSRFLDVWPHDRQRRAHCHRDIARARHAGEKLPRRVLAPKP
jgi:hypothetical protein